jgi:hypothetical protein
LKTFGQRSEQPRSGFAEAKRYQLSMVLDPAGEATATCRVTSLPTVVLIGKNGKLHSVHVGATAQIRAELRRDIVRMLGVNDQRKSS